MRVSATVLERFRLYLTTDWVTEDELVASILGTAPTTPAMALGRAFGAALASPDRYRRPDGTYEVGAYRFDGSLEVALEPIRPGTLFEVPGSVTLGRHEVVCRADQMVGTLVVETKTTTGTPDVARYLESYQWRYMALAFAPSAIEYQVYGVEEQPDGLVTVWGSDTFRVYPYLGLEADCAELLAEFERFVWARGLQAALDGRQEAAQP
jgi:hypothetical protein